jgi:hypothetical protein
VTSEELNEQIKALRFGEFHISEHGIACWSIPDADIPKVKQLISDVVEELLPDECPHYHEDGSKCDLCIGKIGWDIVLDTIRTNKAKLGL